MHLICIVHVATINQLQFFFFFFFKFNFKITQRLDTLSNDLLLFANIHVHHEGDDIITLITLIYVTHSCNGYYLKIERNIFKKALFYTNFKANILLTCNRIISSPSLLLTTAPLHLKFFRIYLIIYKTIMNLIWKGVRYSLCWWFDTSNKSIYFCLRKPTWEF